MRLLVTGVSGLFGLNLAKQVAGRFDVTGVLRGSRAVAVPGRTPFRVIQSDLTQVGEVERVIEEAAPDAIIHCAALTNIDDCELHPAEAEQMNTILPGKLARAAARTGAQFVHISTDAVFDGQRGDYCEEDVPSPINVYGWTKLAGEQAVAEACPAALIARVNFYGWSWVGNRSLAEWFFYQLSAGKNVSGFTDIVFAPLLVNHLVEILMEMIDRRLTGLYHVCSPESISKYTFGSMIARAFGLDEQLIIPVTHTMGGLVACRAPLLNLRSGKLERALGRQLPGQAEAVQRFAALYHERYPQKLHGLLAVPGSCAKTDDSQPESKPPVP